MEDIPASDYIEQLKTNPTVQQWLSQFKYGDKDKFIEAYVELKYKFKSKPPKAEVNDSYRSEYIEIAEEALEAILAKKLFDLELRWRAKEITLKGVEISYDISSWLKEPVNCPFVPEITGEDVEIMKAFLLLPDFETYYLTEHRVIWHDKLRTALNNSEHEQHWFRFHNKHVSNPTPTDLPDLKGAKEEYYRKIHYKLMEEEKPGITSKKSTYVHLEVEERYNLKARLAEAAGLKDFTGFINDESYCYKGGNPVDSEYAWHYLNIHYNDKIPIKSNKNWAKALDLAYQQHAARGAVEQLQTTVDEYRIKKDNNIITHKRTNRYERLVKTIRESILKAREKLGEPGNFDY